MQSPFNSRKNAIALARKRKIPLEPLIYGDRPYKLPKHYYRWTDWCAEAALLLGSGVKQDAALQIHRWRSLLWLAKNAPLYCVRPDLVHQFENTALPEEPGNCLIQGMKLPIDTALFAFPQGLLSTPDGGYVDMVVFHISDAHAPQNSRGQYREHKIPLLRHEYGDRFNLQWSAIDSRTTVWFSGLGINGEGSLIWRDRTNLRGTEMVEIDRAFTRRITALIIQCWLAASFQPDLLGGGLPPAQKQGRRSRQRKKAETWAPRILRMPEKGDRQGKSHGNHASPHAHWRRGHWRNQAVGEGRQQRKPIWIKPRYINPDGPTPSPTVH